MSGPRRRSAARPALIPAVVTAGVVIAVDQLAKAWVLATIEVGETVSIIGPVRFLRAMNRGIAFSFGDGNRFTPYVVSAVVLALTIAIGVAITRTVRHPDMLTGRVGCALGALIGGGWGNQLDRMFRSPGRLRGPVVDFIDLGPWPVFNMADAALSVAVVFLLLHSLRAPAPAPAPVADAMVPHSDAVQAYAPGPTPGRLVDAVDRVDQRADAGERSLH